MESCRNCYKAYKKAYVVIRSIYILQYTYITSDAVIFHILLYLFQANRIIYLMVQMYNVLYLSADIAFSSER